jgi:SAM-dependent methyltransferase
MGLPILGLRVRAQRILPLIRQYAKPELLLDVGSGRGVFTFEMARLFPGSRVVGIDLDEARVETCRRLAKTLGLDNLEFKKQDIFFAALDGQANTLVNIDTLEHVEDDCKFLKRLFQLMAPGGILILHVPHLYRNFFGVKRINFHVDGHVRPGYLLTELREKVEQAGFMVQEIGYTYGSLETLSNDISYLVTRAREKRKVLYSVLFPWLLIVAKAGNFTRPKYGSGVYLVASKPDE